MRKIYSLVIVVLLSAAILGFSFIMKDKIEDPTSSKVPFVTTNLDNLILGAKYVPDNINAIWTESFDGTTFPPTGWVLNQESGTATWQRRTVGTYPVCATHSGAGMAGFNSWTASTGTASLVSSVFSLTSGAAKLGFWMYRDDGYATSADLVNFRINTTASSTGSTLLGTINRSKSLPPVVSGSNGWYYYEFAIPPSFNTATNYVILQGTSAYGNDIYVDDVEVNLLLANNVGMVSIDITSPMMPSTITPKATVKNFGTAVQTFPVTMTITPGGYTNTQTVTALAGGGSYQASFSSWTPTNGTYTVKVITELGTDLDRTNDTLLKTITVTTSAWTPGLAMTSGSYLGSGASYMRNDSAWLVCTGGNAPNLTSTYLYNVRANTWSAGAPMLNSGVVHASATLKDTVYMMGGYGAGTTPTTIFDKYNVRTNTWTMGTPMPAPNGWAKAVGYQDSIIYLAGGYTGSAVLATVKMYNSNTNSWREATPLPGGTIGAAFMRTGDTLVYVGGASLTAPVATTYRGVISQTNRSVITWTTVAPYPAGPMYRFDGASWLPGEVIVGGGSPTTAWTPASPGPAYSYKPSTNTWTALPNLTTPVLGSFVGTVKYSNFYKFILASGYTGAAVTNVVQIYTAVMTGVTNTSTEIPKEYSISQNYPNPFNPSTKINFALPKSGFVSLKIYDVLGREVATLVNEVKSAGQYTADFNASQFTSGIYFYRIESNGFNEVKKMMLIK